MVKVLSRSWIWMAMLVLVTAQWGCKKTVDKIVENAVFDIITDGRWMVTKFESGGTDVLSEYTGYEFQFYKGGVVTAFKTGSANTNGTWEGNALNLSILSNFPVSNPPLNRFNAVWFINSTTATTVNATATIGAQTFTLGLKRV